MEHFSLFHSVVLPYVNFFIFVGLLVYFAKKPIKNMATARLQAFEKSSKEAGELKATVEKEFTELKSRLTNLDQELEQLFANTKSAVEVERRAALAEAQHVAQSIMTEAHQRIKSETLHLLDSVRKEILGEAIKEVHAQLKNSADQPSFQKEQMLKAVSRLSEADQTAARFPHT